MKLYTYKIIIKLPGAIYYIAMADSGSLYLTSHATNTHVVETKSKIVQIYSQVLKRYKSKYGSIHIVREENDVSYTGS